MNSRKHSASLVLISSALALTISSLVNPAQAAGEEWKSATIADALQAAPAAVTDTASIYGWTPEGELVLARYGSGTYTCIASGSFSVRLGKPPLPYPDPMCLDQNAWAFLQALWSEKNPANPERPYPTESGLIWMLAGMNVSEDAVDIGAGSISVAAESSGTAQAEIYQMTPHVMILPLPFEESIAGMGTAYALDAPLGAWIMAAGKPHEHLMVHFSAEDVSALMGAGK
jgi:hypothetical protein